MSDSRLQQKIRETKQIADDAGLDLEHAPLLATFEMPIWGSALATRDIAAVAREPGVAVAVVSTEPLPDVRRAAAGAPNLHVIAERGLVVGMTGGACVHVYPHSVAEMEAFAVALFAGAAPDHLAVALNAYVSSGRQEVAFETTDLRRPCTARELMHAVREHGGTAGFAGEGEEEAIVVAAMPDELESVRAALADELFGAAVRVARLPSGRFRFAPEVIGRPVDPERLRIIAQEIAISCDRLLETRGSEICGFVTEPVARWQYGPEHGARFLASELFSAPDTVLTQLGLHPFHGEGTMFFAYEGSETVWEAWNKGISCVTVRDISEYARILSAVRRGE